mgnify:CR=1 FL=1
MEGCRGDADAWVEPELLEPLESQCLGESRCERKAGAAALRVLLLLVLLLWVLADL